jgi:dihydroorotase
LKNHLVMLRAMEYAATFNLTVFINALDHDLANSGTAHQGAVSTRLGLPPMPAAAETAAVAAYLSLIEQIGVRAHFSLLSTARAAQIIARAQHDGLPVTADVSAHHLHLTENDVHDFDSHCHEQPPLRTLRDREGLRQWLARGTIAAICSDHQPHEADAKLRPFGETEPGISGLDTLLSLSLKLVDEGVLTLSEMVARLSSGPARILGIHAGRLGAGDRADVCVFDPARYWVLSREAMASQGKNSPLLDWELKGRVQYTLLSGRIVYQLDSTS